METTPRHAVVLVACSIGSLATYAGHTFGFSLFLPHVGRAVGLGEAGMGCEWAVALFGAALALPVLGPLLDRYDVRVVVFWSALCFSAACAFMGCVSNRLELCVGLFTMRLLGPGLLLTAMISTMNRWFVLRRGKAAAVFQSLNWLQLCFATPINRSIHDLGWRATYRVVAVIAFILFIIVSCLIRTSPESSQASKKKLAKRVSVTRVWTRSDAMRSSLFWVMMAAVCTVELVWTGINLHMVEILGAAQVHLSLEQIAQTEMIMALSAMLSTMATGVVIDCLHDKHRLLGVALILGMCTTYVAQSLVSLSAVVVFGVCLGGMAGIVDVCIAVVFADAFGEHNVGAILSAVNAGMTVCNGAMAVALGAAADAGRLGDAFRCLMYMIAPIGILVLCQTKPRGEDVEVHSYTLWSPMMWSPMAV